MLRILLILVVLVTIACGTAKAEVVDEDLRRCITIITWVASKHAHEVSINPETSGYFALGGSAHAPRLPRYPSSGYGGRSTLPQLIDEHCAPYIDAEFLESVRTAPVR